MANFERVLEVASDTLFPMLKLHKGVTSLRAVCVAARDTVTAFPWDDKQRRIVHSYNVDAWLACFPHAVSFHGAYLTDEQHGTLCTSLKRLRWLEVHGFRTISCIRALAAGLMHVPLLRHLRLSGGIPCWCDTDANNSWNELATALAHMPHLKQLLLDDIELDAARVHAITSTLVHLEALVCTYNNMEAKGVQALATSLVHMPRLLQLTLDFNNLCDATADLAAALLYVPKLEELSLSGNNIDAHGARALAASLAQVPCLTRLNVRNNCFSNDGMRHLAHGLMHTPNLVCLDVGGNGLHKEGAQALGDCLPKLSKLEKLHIDANQVYNDGVYALVAGLKHTCLKWLDISCIHMADDGARAVQRFMMESPQTVNVNARNNELTKAVRLEILQSAIRKQWHGIEP